MACGKINDIPFCQGDKAINLYEVSQREPQLICQLTTIWEDSVRATHLFLSEAEIQKIKAYVPHALTGVSHLLVAEKMPGQPVAFMGLEGHRLEMLFLSPAERGAGLGRQLLEYGILHYRPAGIDGQRAEPAGRRLLPAYGLRDLPANRLRRAGRPLSPSVHETGLIFP